MYAYFLDQEYQPPDPSLEHLADDSGTQASTNTTRKNAAGPICNAGPGKSAGDEPRDSGR